MYQSTLHVWCWTGDMWEHTQTHSNFFILKMQSAAAHEIKCLRIRHKLKTTVLHSESRAHPDSTRGRLCLYGE